MDRLPELILANAVLATGLAALVALVTRRRCHPAVAHVLWLLVLAKLVTPAWIPVGLVPAVVFSPLARVESVFGAWPAAGGWPAGGSVEARDDGVPPRGDRSPGPDRALPDGERRGEASPVPVAWEAGTGETSGGPSAAVAGGFDLRGAGPAAALALAAAIAAGILGVAAFRFVRFRRMLAATSEAPGPLRDCTVRLARRLGLRRVPRVRITDETWPPLVVPGPQGAEVVLPARLLAGLTAPERDALLAHELAHVVRRDPWVRPFELLVTALFWWHPVLWWARRRLRVAEEQACDALVLRALPGRGRPYAEGLLRTLEFLHDRSPASAPALATGADTSHLEERLTMIATESSARPLPRFRRAAIALVGLALLMIAPATRDSGAAVAETAAPPAPAEAPPAVRPPAEAPPVPPATARTPAAVAPVPPVDAIPEPLLALRHEELELQRELRALEIRRVKIEQEWQDRQMAAQLAAMQQQIAAFEAAGEAEEAAAMRRDFDLMESEMRLHRSRLEIEMEQAQVRMELEEQLEMLSLERDAAEARAELDRVREFDLQLREVEGHLRRQEIEMMRAQLEMEEQELERRKRQLDRAAD